MDEMRDDGRWQMIRKSAVDSWWLVVGGGDGGRTRVMKESSQAGRISKQREEGGGRDGI